MTRTSNATGSAPSEARPAGFSVAAAFTPNMKMTNTSTKVPMISLIVFQG